MGKDTSVGGHSVKKVITLYAELKCFAAVGRALSPEISRQRVHQIVDKHGESFFKDVVKKREEEITKLGKQGLYLPEIKSITGFANSTIVAHLNKAGIKYKKKTEINLYNRGVQNQDKNDEICRLFLKENLTVEQLASRFNLKRPSIQRILSISGAHKGGRRKTSRDAWYLGIYNLYESKTKTAAEIKESESINENKLRYAIRIGSLVAQGK